MGWRLISRRKKSLTRCPRAKSAGLQRFSAVQEGCDKFCTFCVVPYTRGAEYSRGVDAIMSEARDLARQGVEEIVLIGQNVNAWHGAAPTHDAKGGEWRLGDLIRHVAKIGGVERIRYMTSHPRDMTDDLIAAHGDVEKLSPFLHLPVQAGSDRVLKAMNRQHTAEHYLSIVDRVRQARPDIALASDFIVGFPGESDADFEDTLALVKAARFAQAYAFEVFAAPRHARFGHAPAGRGRCQRRTPRAPARGDHRTGAGVQSSDGRAQAARAVFARRKT